MTNPKTEQAAKELVDKFFSIKLYNKHANTIEEIEHAKACANICIQFAIDNKLNRYELNKLIEQIKKL